MHERHLDERNDLSLENHVKITGEKLITKDDLVGYTIVKRCKFFFLREGRNVVNCFVSPAQFLIG